MALPVNTAKAESLECFFVEISHYIYGGDTALHLAAAAYRRPMAELLVAKGADCRARNRRGATPLHYAADGRGVDESAQSETIEYLVSVGADPNAEDKSGVAPLHRAVRTRSTSAVKTLLDAGANLRQRNKSGATPLHLAVQTTGASGSGADESRARQEAIIRLLFDRGAKLSDRDANGRTAAQAATGKRIREFLTTLNQD